MPSTIVVGTLRCAVNCGKGKTLQILPAIDLRAGKCVNLVQGIATQGNGFLRRACRNGATMASRGCGILTPRRFRWCIFKMNQRTSTSSARLSLRLIYPSSWVAGIRSNGTIGNGSGIRRGSCDFRHSCPQTTEPRETGVCQNMARAIAVGIDAKDGRVATEGWVGSLSENPLLNSHRRWRRVQTIIYTDIKSDGMLKGPNVDATADIIDAVPANCDCFRGVSHHSLT